jgi:hypothetical protein
MMDNLEVYDFVYGYLPRKIFHDVSSFPDWIKGEQKEDHFLEINEWSYFVETTRLYLRPSNIIELLVLSTWDSRASWPPNRPKYLRLLGFSDEDEGVCRILDDTRTPETLYSVMDIENDVESKLREVCSGDADSLARAWDRYRHDLWTQDARGRVLGREESSDQIIRRIRFA